MRCENVCSDNYERQNNQQLTLMFRIHFGGQRPTAGARRFAASLWRSMLGIFNFFGLYDFWCFCSHDIDAFVIHHKILLQVFVKIM